MLLTCRWWIMGTVILLNLANFAHWIAFPAVAKKAAAYYEVRVMIICIRPRRTGDVILPFSPQVLVLKLCSGLPRLPCTVVTNPAAGVWGGARPDPHRELRGRHPHLSHCHLPHRVPRPQGWHQNRQPSPPATRPECCSAAVTGWAPGGVGELTVPQAPG